MEDIGTLANDKLSKIEGSYMYTIRINGSRCKDYSEFTKCADFTECTQLKQKHGLFTQKASEILLKYEEFYIKLRANTSIQAKHINIWTNLPFIGTLTDNFGECTVYLRSFWKSFQFGYPPFWFRQPPPIFWTCQLYTTRIIFTFQINM